MGDQASLGHRFFNKLFKRDKAGADNVTQTTQQPPVPAPTPMVQQNTENPFYAGSGVLHPPLQNHCKILLLPYLRTS